jgi:CBS domain-containing protein
MQEDVDVLSAENTLLEVKEWVLNVSKLHPVNAIAVVDENENLLGTVRINEIQQSRLPGDTPIAALLNSQNIYVYNDSLLSFTVDLMDRFNVDYLPVVERSNKRKIAGIITHKDVFAAYRKRRNEESIYKRNISLRRRGYKLIVKGKQMFE